MPDVPDDARITAKLPHGRHDFQLPPAGRVPSFPPIASAWSRCPRFLRSCIFSVILAGGVGVYLWVHLPPSPRWQLNHEHATVSFAPDGRSLVAHFWKYDNPEFNEAGDAGTLLVDLDTGQEIPIEAEYAVLDNRRILFSEDGQTVGTFSSGQALVIRNCHTGAEVRVIPTWSRRGNAIVWADGGGEASWKFLERRRPNQSADGKRRASQAGHSLSTTDVDRAATHTVNLAANIVNPRLLDLSPDATKYLVSGTPPLENDPWREVIDYYLQGQEFNKIYLVDASSGTTLAQLPGTAAVFAPDGTSLLVLEPARLYDFPLRRPWKKVASLSLLALAGSLLLAKSLAWLAAVLAGKSSTRLPFRS